MISSPVLCASLRGIPSGDDGDTSHAACRSSKKPARPRLRESHVGADSKYQPWQTVLARLSERAAREPITLVLFFLRMDRTDLTRDAAERSRRRSDLLGVVARGRDGSSTTIARRRSETNIGKIDRLVAGLGHAALETACVG